MSFEGKRNMVSIPFYDILHNAEYRMKFELHDLFNIDKYGTVLNNQQLRLSVKNDMSNESKDKNELKVLESRDQNSTIMPFTPRNQEENRIKMELNIYLNKINQKYKDKSKL